MGKEVEDELFYLVSAQILPEAILKTVKAKKLISNREADTVFEAVEKVGLSRSAYYKYKDGIFPFNALMKEKVVMLSIDLEHKQGFLSNLLKIVAEYGGNILTINQTIPLEDMANIVLSIDTVKLDIEVTELLEVIEDMSGVIKIQVISRG